MSARSFLRSGCLLGLVALAGCPKAKAPEADPAQVTSLAKAMMSNMPPPGFRDCAPGEVMGGATLTNATLYKLTRTPMPPNPKNDGTIDPKLDTWLNPDELVSPAALTLAADGANTDVARRRAAAELLAAPFYLVYRVDLIDAPMAQGFKEQKRGTIGARAIRFDKSGMPYCVRNFTFQNDFARSERAIAMSDKAQMDPEVVKALQSDLKEQMLRTVASLGASRNAAAPRPAKPVEGDPGGASAPGSAGSAAVAGSATPPSTAPAAGSATPASGSGSTAAGSDAGSAAAPAVVPDPVPARPAPRPRPQPKPPAATGSGSAEAPAPPPPAEPAPEPAPPVEGSGS